MSKAEAADFRPTETLIYRVTRQTLIVFILHPMSKKNTGVLSSSFSDGVFFSRRLSSLRVVLAEGDMII